MFVSFKARVKGRILKIDAKMHIWHIIAGVERK